MLGFIDRKSVEDDFLVSQFRQKKQTLGVWQVTSPDKCYLLIDSIFHNFTDHMKH